MRGKKLLDAIRGGHRRRHRDRLRRAEEATPRSSTSPRPSSRPAGDAITPGALRALVSAFSDDLAELAARLPAARLRRQRRDHRGDGREVLRRSGRDQRVHGRRCRDRRPARGGAPGSGTRWHPVPIRCRSSRRSRSSCARWRRSPGPARGPVSSPRSSASRRGRSTAPAATWRAGPTTAWDGDPDPRRDGREGQGCEPRPGLRPRAHGVGHLGARGLTFGTSPAGGGGSRYAPAGLLDQHARARPAPGSSTSVGCGARHACPPPARRAGRPNHADRVARGAGVSRSDPSAPSVSGDVGLPVLRVEVEDGSAEEQLRDAEPDHRRDDHRRAREDERRSR